MRDKFLLHRHAAVFLKCRNDHLSRCKKVKNKKAKFLNKSLKKIIINFAYIVEI